MVREVVGYLGRRVVEDIFEGFGVVYGIVERFCDELVWDEVSMVDDDEEVMMDRLKNRCGKVKCFLVNVVRGEFDCGEEVLICEDMRDRVYYMDGSCV